MRPRRDRESRSATGSIGGGSGTASAARRQPFSPLLFIASAGFGRRVEEEEDERRAQQRLGTPFAFILSTASTSYPPRDTHTDWRAQKLLDPPVGDVRVASFPWEEAVHVGEQGPN